MLNAKTSSKRLQPRRGRNVIPHEPASVELGLFLSDIEVEIYFSPDIGEIANYFFA